MTTIPVLDASDPLAKPRLAIATLRSLLAAGRPVAVSWSGGKDSSAALNLALVAAAELRADGAPVPPIIVTHSDTLIENPEIVAYTHGEMAKIERFASLHGLDVRIRIATPSLSQSWAFRVIGQGKLPTFPGDPRECSVEFKVKPQGKLLKQTMAELRASGALAAGAEPVVVIGTRFSEGAGREARMTERGERAGAVWQGAFGFDYLSPIADWSINDVWSYLSLNMDYAALFGDPHQWHSLAPLLEADVRWTSYSDFTETIRIYAAATGNACGVVGDLKAESVKRAEACGARFGCHLCTAVGRDKSLETMIASDTRYDFMTGLNRLQRWLLATRWDWSRRNWLGRTINAHGFQRIQPDTYGARTVEDLLRMCLTLDITEAEAADALEIAPRFQLISPETLIGIDIEWSRYGTHRPFHALQVFLEIQRGARYPVPELEEVPRTPRPAARYLHVGRGWDEGNEWEFTGLRSVWEMFEECPGNQTVALANGRTVLDVQRGEQFEVDPESAMLVLSLEAERLVREYHDDPQAGPTRAYELYLMLGVFSMVSHARGKTDDILRRTNWRARHGLAEATLDLDTLVRRSISAAEYQELTGDTDTDGGDDADGGTHHPRPPRARVAVRKSAAPADEAVPVRRASPRRAAARAQMEMPLS